MKLSEIVRRFEGMNDSGDSGGKRSLNEDQMNALKIVIGNYKTGGQMVLTGSGGTGKSFFISTLKRYCDSKDIACDITATTGKASSAINGQTIHSYLGLKMGVNDNADSSDEALKLGRDEDADVDKPQILVIDEFSLIGESMMREIKKDKFNFILFVGDIEQLAPVKDSVVNWEDEADYYYKLSINMRAKDVRLKDIADDFRKYKMGKIDSIDIKDYINGDNIIEIDYEDVDTIDANSDSCFIAYRNKLVEKFARKLTHENNTMMNLNAGVQQTVMVSTGECNRFGQYSRDFKTVPKYPNGEDVEIKLLEDITSELVSKKSVGYKKWNLRLTKKGIMISDPWAGEEADMYFISFPPDDVLEYCTLCIINDEVFTLIWSGTEDEKKHMHDHYFEKLKPYLSKKRASKKSKQPMNDDDDRMYRKGWRDFLSAQSVVSARPTTSRTSHKAQGGSYPCTILCKDSFYGASAAAKYVMASRQMNGIVFINNVPEDWK